MIECFDLLQVASVLPILIFVFFSIVARKWWDPGWFPGTVFLSGQRWSVLREGADRSIGRHCRLPLAQPVIDSLPLSIKDKDRVRIEFRLL